MSHSLDERRYRIRHSAAHVLADAVMELFPDAKLAIGPPVEHGFYYDFDVPRAFTPEDLERLEAIMAERIGRALPFEMSEVSRAEAAELFSAQPYKLEILEDLGGDEVVTTCRHGEFLDLCRGAARGADVGHPGVQAALGGGRLLAGVTRTGLGFSVSTGRPGSPCRSSSSTWCASRRRSGVTIGAWGGTWICSRSRTTWGRACRCGIRGGRWRCRSWRRTGGGST